MHQLMLWIIPILLLLSIILLTSLGPLTLPKRPVKKIEFPPNPQALFTKLDHEPEAQSSLAKDELSIFSTILKREMKLKSKEHKSS